VPGPKSLSPACSSPIQLLGEWSITYPALVYLLGFHADSERNHCRLRASLRCVPPTGSVLVKAVRVLWRSAEEPFEVAAESLALGEGTEEVVEAGDIILQRTRAGAAGSRLAVMAPPPPLEHSRYPRSTSCRYGPRV